MTEGYPFYPQPLPGYRHITYDKDSSVKPIINKFVEEELKKRRRKFKSEQREK